MNISPVDRSDLFSWIQTPYSEGCARLTLAWQGVDFSLEPTPLAWEERVLYWLQGTLLMIPIVNTITWLVWKTFGQPASWTDPFCPEESAPPADLQIRPTGSNNESCYITIDGKLCIQQVEAFANCQIVTQTSEGHSISASYENQVLTEWVCLHDKELTRIRNTPRGIEIQSTPPILLRNSAAPWIQQPGIGLKNWILSDESVLEFDTVLYEYPSHSLCFLPWIHFDPPPFLLAMCAAKKEALQTPEGRRLIKVEISPQAPWLLQVLYKSEWWFDATTGELYQFSNAGLFMRPESGRVVQNDP